MSRRLFLAIAAALFAATAACEDSTPVRTVEPPAGRDGVTPDQVVENGEHIITDQGVKKAVLNAEQLYFYNETSKVFGDTIEVRFFDEAGTFASVLTAESGELDQSTQGMIARGNVFVRGRESTIKTEELHYDPRANRIFSDVPTEIVQRGNVIKGQGVESDPSLREIRIRGSSAVLRSEPGRERGENAASARDST